MVATRGMTERQAADRIRSQSSTAERRELADIVIDSTRPIPDMLAQVDGLYRRWELTESSAVKRCEPGSAAKRT